MRPLPLAIPLLALACGSTPAPGTTSGSGGSSGGGATSSGGTGGATSSTSITSTPSGTTSSSTSTSSTSETGSTSSTTTSSTTTTTSTSTTTTGTTCSPVSAQPDVDPWTVRAPGAGFGGINTQTSGGHTDVFLDSPASGGMAAGYVRIGARLDWGGTVVFFGLGASAASNVIDANDTGRELQVALYDPTRSRQPCAGSATCLTSSASCGNSITYLGWDPVQGGDECGHGAPVTAHGQAGEALRLVVSPLQWNPDWDRADCAQSACGAAGVPVGVTYTMELRFVSVHVVEVMTEVSSQETIDHPVTGQEFPTLYVSYGQGGPDLHQLFDAAGQPVSLTTPANDGFLYGNFTSPGPWVSFQNAQQSYGVGLAMDQGLRDFQGWTGGPGAPHFHNVRAQIAFGLGAGKRVRGLSYLALGSFATVAGELGATLKKRPPFGVVDAPAAGAPATFAAGTPLPVGGWALDDRKVSSVRIEIDGATAGTLPVAGARPDVCEAYPAYDGCPAVGFSGTVPTAGLSPCPHLLRVVAEDADGNATVLGERVIQPQ